MLRWLTLLEFSDLMLDVLLGFLALYLVDAVGTTPARAGAAVELLLLPAFLLAPGVWTKYLLLGLLDLFNAGWYSILMAQLYSSVPGQSGTVMTVGNVFGYWAG